MDAKAKSNPAAQTDRVLVMTRVFDSPREVVFRAWTDPKHIASWWGPRGFTNPRCEWDARPGAAIRIDMRGPDGTVYPMGGTFHEVTPPERLVFTSTALEDERGQPGLEVLNTVTLTERNGKTTLRLEARVVRATAAAAGALAGMDAGWSQSLDRLGEEVATAADPADRPFVISRTFDAPRELVWKAWTERDRLMQWFGPKGFTMPVAALDFRPGGVFHYCLRGPDGKEMWGKFVYREIVPPEQIVLVNSFSDAQGNLTRHPFASDWPAEMLSTTTFVEIGGKTTITIQWAPLNPTEAERRTFEAGRDGMRQGWTGTFEQLAAYLASV